MVSGQSKCALKISENPKVCRKLSCRTRKPLPSRLASRPVAMDLKEQKDKHSFYLEATDKNGLSV